MNIRDFYTINDNTLPESFEESEFVKGVENYIGDVLKSCVIAFTSDETANDASETPLQLATGGIAKRKSKSASEKEQKWSFCSEIQSMTSSLIGLLGFDMAKHLLVLIGIKRIIQNVIDNISKNTVINALILSYRTEQM